jgi:hypothetical protein
VTVSPDGGIFVTVPEGLGQPWRGQQIAWREVFRGHLDRATAIPNGIGATLTSVYGKRATYRTTFKFAESSQSLTGDLVDANRVAAGRIELSRGGD